MVNRQRGVLPADIAAARIGKLSRIAGRSTSDPELKRNSTVMMERLSRRVNITLPPDIKRSYCKRCHYPYSSPVVRVRRNIVRVRCGNCGDLRRIPYR